MKSVKWMNVRLNMPVVVGQELTTAGEWVAYMLQLGEASHYNLLTHYLLQAKACGCLSILRLATENLVRQRVRGRQIGLKKCASKSVSERVAA